jgi:hypothetical protein
VDVPLLWDRPVVHLCAGRDLNDVEWQVLSDDPQRLADTRRP